MGLFGFVKKAIGGLVQTVVPGPIGAFAGGIIRGGPAGFGTPAGFQGGQRGLPPGSRVQFPTPGFIGGVQRFLPGGSTGFTNLPEALIPRGPGGIAGLLPGVPGGVTGFAQENGGCPPGDACPKGHHLNRSTYFLKDGTLVVEGTRCVANRRRNPENFRANRKAAGRLLARKRTNDRMDKALASLAPRRTRRAKTVPTCP